MEVEMYYRHFTFVIGLAISVLLTQTPAAAQAQRAKANNTTAKQDWTPPRTVEGQPDLQGVWANNNATPLERPKDLAGRAFLTDQEVAALKQKAGELFGGDGDAAFGDGVFEAVLASVKQSKAGPHKKAADEFDAGTGDYSSVWTVARDWDNRTSLIINPADGRLPPMTPEGQKRRDAAAAARNRPAAGPEDRSLSERCITFGSPRLGAGYNSYFQIVQSAKQVAILMETIHDVRVIPLDGSTHLPSNVQTWLGDPRGRWEGDTLVVDTTNYLPGVFMNVSTEKLHVVEKFTRASPETLNWEITIDDPGAWSKPWIAMIPLRHSKDALYEYSCHEDNYGLYDILAGARAEENR